MRRHVQITPFVFSSNYRREHLLVLSEELQVKYLLVNS
jgi:hypothetical protein